MHAFKSLTPPAALALCLALLPTIGACGAETLCPDGFQKSGKLCLQEEGNPSVSGDAGLPVADDAALGADAPSPNVSNDAAANGAGFDAGTELDAAGSDAAAASDAASAYDTGSVSTDASASTDGATDPAPECDALHPCSSSGYSCLSNKCVSACADTRCDENATCGLVRGAPVCSCNSGFLPTGSAGAIRCVRDVACAELGCDTNATCEVGTDRLRHCVCKTDFSGDGKSCTRVSCPALSTLRVDNGRVSTSDGTTTVGKVATYRCNDGYKVSAGGPLVCDETGKWTGIPTVCSPISCAAPTVVVAHAALTTPDQTSYRPNDRATYACAAGYKPMGEASITCRNDGSWGAPTLTCTAACGDGVLDPGPGLAEECDPALNDLSAWTCNKECKRCPGGLCRPACTSNSSCPDALNGLTLQCVANECVLSCSTTGPNRCPQGTLCTASGGGAARCTPQAL